MAAQRTLYRFSVGEYNKMGEVGIFSEDDRVELIRGEIVEMAPISVRHAWCVTNLTSIIFRLALDRVRLSVQNPIYLNQYSEALPDITLLRQRDYSRDTRHPGPDDVLLIVEVADTTVTWDRKVKGHLYAQTGIPEVWIVNVQQGSIEVHSRPEGGAYQTSRRLRRGQSIVVPGFAEIRVKVDDVLR